MLRFLCLLLEPLLKHKQLPLLFQLALPARNAGIVGHVGGDADVVCIEFLGSRTGMRR